MAHINLLPWRRAKCRAQQREFALISGFSAVLKFILMLYVHIHVNGMIGYEERRN
jgi:Tfp pilus assembly protein PilN